MRALEGKALCWNASEVQCLVVGGIAMTACIFVGRNINYWGIYFLVLPKAPPAPALESRSSGPASLGADDRSGVVRDVGGAAAQRALHAIVAPAPGSGLGSQA